jgi:hypothetical protein
MTQAPAKQMDSGQPWWPALIAVLSMCGLYLSLPESLTFGPSWLLVVVVFVLMVPAVIAKIRGSFALNQVLGFIVLGIVTAAMLWSLFMLVRSLLIHRITPSDLLRSATALWATNILVFASWYWRLDAGGPHARHLRGKHTEGDFLFPQMTLAPRTEKPLQPSWSPGFVDSLSRVQHQHGILSYRFAGTLPLGQGCHDVAIHHLLRHGGPAGRARGEHTVVVISLAAGIRQRPCACSPRSRPRWRSFRLPPGLPASSCRWTGPAP